jgi:hypothetical protein
VSIHNDAVYINNHRLKEPYVGPGYRPLYPYSPSKVPRGDYFVLGDNRNNSDDSHLWGMLAKRYIIGRVVVSNTPKRAFGKICLTRRQPAHCIAICSAVDARGIAVHHYPQPEKRQPDRTGCPSRSAVPLGGRDALCLR